MNRFELKKIRRARRKMSIRRDIYGTMEKPRLSVFRSLNNIFVQLIDDTNGNVIVSASTIDKEVKTKITDKMTKIDKSKLIGKIIAERAIAKNIKEKLGSYTMWKKESVKIENIIQTQCHKLAKSIDERKNEIG